jgi:uncharacterized protein (UPF0276 family)
MIKLAVPDRPLTRRLIATGEIVVDYLETTGPRADTAIDALPDQPFLVHNSVWNWSLAHPAAMEQQNVVPVTLDMIEGLHAPWLSVHLGFGAAEVVFDGWMKPASAPLPRDQLFEIICHNVRALAQALPVPFLIENLDYNPGGAYDFVCDPDFIADVLAETGVGFLLDTAHARVSAARLGFGTDDYLSRLPLDRVQQLHVSGPRWREGTLVDTHDPLLDEDDDLLESLLRITSPRVLTLEYDKDEAALRAQLHRLRTVIAAQVEPTS